VVTVADNGGSSGACATSSTSAAGRPAPGARGLCGDDEWGRTWASVLQHRFASEGRCHDHAVGNLLIVALWELLGDPVGGLDWVGRLLGAHGRVLPMCSVPLDITAEVLGADPSAPLATTTVSGQVEVATASGEVLRVTLEPADPPACAETLAAVRDADWIVLGPGSWFTSVIPHLLVPELRAALQESTARKLVVLNLVPQVGETEGFSPEQHLEVLARHAPLLNVDVVLADRGQVDDEPSLRASAGALGAELVIDAVASTTSTARHDTVLLAGVFERILTSRPRRSAGQGNAGEAGAPSGIECRRGGARRASGDGRTAGSTMRLAASIRQAGNSLMAMTAQVKSELAGITVTKSSCRKAEASTMLRFAGGLHIVGGKIVVEAELDTGAAARRLRKDLVEVYGHQSEVVVVSGGGLKAAPATSYAW
jgi:uncharacterized cofD-like protein